ncbi:MAG: B12-binding domain-containing radical SAM protein [Syntrophobacteraceae bacterium]|jgi:radical SAM superfamily enzyme YgiQ (UPF0313 family)
MNALLIYPSFPVTFWSLKEALPFLPARATIPPLGLLTVAAMLPDTWGKRLLDMNVRPLTDQDLAWADVAFIGAMAIQAQSTEEAIRRCRAAGVRICSGGVIYATPRDDLSPVDHLFLGEVEDTLPQFLVDLQAGKSRAVYQAEGFPDLARTPRPQWDLINFSDYLTMALQVTRGCPHDCDFCHVAIINGRRPRSKDVAQVLAEIDGLYQAGWRGPVMFVDDNFIGQKAVARRVLTALADWQARHSYPFIFLSQASVEVADHADLLALLQRAGFLQLFLGLETPAAASLAECNKKQNLKRDLIEAVRIIQKHSIDVLGGFIVGFDADPPTIFEEMAEFIEQAALPTAMVGVLAAPPGTRLYARLAAENRLTGQSDGDSIANLSGMNVIPVMGRARLLSGYKRLLTRLYEPRRYYRRVADFLSHFCPNPFLPGRLPTRIEVRTFLRVVWALGIKDPDRRSFWGFLVLALLRFPRLFPLAIATIVGGYHYKIVSRRFAATPH